MKSRRDFLLAAGSIVFASVAAGARATPAAMHEAVRKVAGDAEIRRGLVKLQIAPLIDNGNVVPLTVTVDSPMTPDNRVRAIHVFAEKNPLPNVLSVYFGARAARARVVTRIRLADSQTVTAIAELSDGSFWSDTGDVVVTLSACLEDIV
jgi:sulfur-oxidizing protein SoxY